MVASALVLGSVGSAFAYDVTFTCPGDSNVCDYNVATAADKGAGNAGKSGDIAALIVAPGNLYFTDVNLNASEHFGVHGQCEVIQKQGQQNRQISSNGATFTVTFVKAYGVRSHIETGSNGGMPMHAHMQCKFHGNLSPLP